MNKCILSSHFINQNCFLLSYHYTLILKCHHCPNSNVWTWISPKHEYNWLSKSN